MQLDHDVTKPVLLYFIIDRLLLLPQSSNRESPNLHARLDSPTFMNNLTTIISILFPCSLSTRLR